MFTASDVIYRHPCRILDPTSAAETARLRLQYTAVSACLDLFPPLPQDESTPHVLNLASSAGNWLLDAAYALPDAVVIGIDAHQQNIDYAHATLPCMPSPQRFLSRH